MTNEQIVQNIDNRTPLTEEEGLHLTEFYVDYFWRTKRFYSLAEEMEAEDVVQILMMKFLQHNHFAKYDNRITSKKYHIMNAVRTSMIDLLRKHRDVLSLDYEIEEGLTAKEFVDSGEVNIEEAAVGRERRDRIIAQLPDTSKSSVIGYSTLLNREVCLSYRVLALHLEAGYKIKDIANMFINPSTHQRISEGTVSSYIRDMREFVLDNIVIA